MKPISEREAKFKFCPLIKARCRGSHCMFWVKEEINSTTKGRCGKQ